MDKIGYSWSMRRASKFIRDNSPKPRWYETGEINQVESENGDYVVYKLKFLGIITTYTKIFRYDY